MPFQMSGLSSKASLKPQFAYALGAHNAGVGVGKVNRNAIPRPGTLVYRGRDFFNLAGINHSKGWENEAGNWPAKLR